MIDWLTLPLSSLVAVFIAATGLIAVAGTTMAITADRLADRTGMGEALMGAVFLGASTSLPGIVTSTAAAWDGYADLAASNAIGGIAVQTAFLSLGDLVYRKANLEHAAASPANVFNSVLLIALLSLPIAAIALPLHWGFVHPVSVLIVVGYFYGVRQGLAAQAAGMWRPRLTSDTRPDQPAEPRGGRIRTRLLVRFGILASVLAVCGLAVENTAGALIEKAALQESVVGAFFTAVSTSLPELVTTIAAVRRGALTLAVAGIVGGNTFDVLFLAAADMAYTSGSLYGVLGPDVLFLLALTIIMSAVLALGLVRRERHGFANIGFESVLVLVLYVVGVLVLVQS